MNKKLEKSRQKLNKLIENNADYRKILKQSQKLDKYILQFYKNSSSNKKHN